MRSRVAYIVTLSALVMLTLLLGYSCTRFAKEENVELSARVMSSCTTISEITRDFDPDDRVDAVGDMYAGRLTGFGLYDADAKAIYRSEEMHEELFPDEISAAKTGEVVLSKHVDSDGKAFIFAIYRYEDGAFLIFEVREATLITILADNPELIVLGVVFSFCLICFIFVLFYMHQREVYLNAVMRALDRFADGNFDARIDEFSGKDTETEAYNAIIARIQDRVFRQRDRNNVISNVMSQMQNGIIAVDADLRVIFVTSVAKKLLGIVGNAEGLLIHEASKDVRLDELFKEATPMRSPPAPMWGGDTGR